MVAIIAVVVVSSLVWFFFVKTVPPGRVGVATLFGNVIPEGYTQGIHVPVNPLYSWTMFDAREKTHLETANVPSQDQLQTRLDVSVQYRIDGVMAPRILEETGDAESAVRVHLIPKLRSLLREQGKSIQRAEDFFLEETQDTLQTALTGGLKEYLAPKGIEVTAVLIRDITLPPFIVEAIERKKEREQAVERERAELERVRTELQQQVARAEAGRQASEEEAARKRILADAQAYEITQINNAIARNPAYIQLQSLEALKAISKDPASKMYFMDGSSPNPLPLMHLGDTQKLQ
jgi:regulator of protease activity HflC (stomatin/prohibitin superfamily)